MPKVSVVVPCYNIAPYLVECMESIINQTLKDIEIICIDDGSTDSSLDILKGYANKDSRIKVLTQVNKGAGVARNNGINNATGEFVAFMDGDDCYPNIKTLELMYSKAIANNVDICGGSLNQIKNDQIITDQSKFENDYTFKKEGIIEYVNYQFDYGYWRFIYKLNFLKANNCIFPNYVRGQDPPFFIKAMSLAKKFYALKEATYLYRVSHKNIEWNEKKVIDKYQSILDSLEMAQKQNLQKLETLIYKRINNMWFINQTNGYFTSEKVKEILDKIISLCSDKNKIKNLLINLAPKISIILSVYNTELYLRECLDSVVNQTLKDIEIICVNDGSTDGSLNILKEYQSKDSRIIVVDQENKGLATSRNNALQIAKGQFIQFVDADDLLVNNACEILYNKCVKHNLDMLSFSCFSFIDETKEQIYKPYYNFEYLPQNVQEKFFHYTEMKDILHKMAVTSGLTIYKRELINSNNILFPNGLFFEDNVFFLKAWSKANKMGILKQKLYKKRVHENEITQNWDKHFSDYIKISDIVLEYLKSIHIDKTIYNNYYNRYKNSCIEFYCSFDLEKQKQYYKELSTFLEKYELKYKWFERIFSIKNYFNKKYKVISILGIKIKIKRKKVEKYLQGIFSVQNIDIHKVITILGIKIKIKSKKLIKRQQKRKEQEQIKNLLLQVEKLQQQEQQKEKLINTLNKNLDQVKRNFDQVKKNSYEIRKNFEYKLCKYMPEDKYSEYLQDWFYNKKGEVLHLDNPQTFNEKIQWMKLYDSTPLKTRLADKYLVRDWVKEKIGEEYLIPLLGVWENFDDIDFDKLPNQFVLKANHGSGWNIIVKDKNEFDKKEAKSKFDEWLHTNFAYQSGFELQYKDIKPLIIAEKYLATEENDLQDYKFLCFSGEVKYIWVDKDRYTNHKRNLFDPNWNLLPEKISEGYVYENWFPCPKPKNLDKMLEFAKLLSKGMNFVRVDFYEHDNNLYFGEMTFTSASGLHIFSPKDFNLQLGELIQLGQKKD